ncbi:ABC transporter ATP-binding protein [Solitalea longa]|uniref:ABC transporter ATP-binding protein n=2 Tax=Solitalea longa TaxID=2079460 RepID=A0A2S5A0Q7_9SPHI|nr:ABC transporter ATP-binding protein [Solitalea longa]
MLILQNLSFIHPNKDLLFENIDLTITTRSKIALIGNNGTGKSTLLKIMAGLLQPSAGTIHVNSFPYYIPQHYGQFNQLTIAHALGIDEKLKALHEILNGSANELNMAILNDDWMIEERCSEALAHWGLSDIDLTAPMKSLSGGQKTKVFLSGIVIHQAEVVLMDEPSNHLDKAGRQLLYDFIKTTPAALLVVSHDRKLLNLLNSVNELSKRGITVYGGNYEFYAEQKRIENEALHQDVRSREKALRKAKEVERETLERQQKLDAKGKKKQEKAGLPTIMMNTLRNSAEKSTSKAKSIHAEKVGSIASDLTELRKELPDVDKMKFGFDNSNLHKGKTLVTANEVNYQFEDQQLWKQPLTFQLNSGERIALSGLNGSGKTTLIRLILGELEPKSGQLSRAQNKTVYIDQDYSLIDNHLKVYEQAQQMNESGLQEHEVKIRLNRFLFSKETWDKPCHALSGGEKMRLMLCCLTISHQQPDIIVLDEPTNNLDIQNIEILTSAINDYSGTLIVVSHDEYFLNQINIERSIVLKE